MAPFTRSATPWPIIATSTSAPRTTTVTRRRPSPCTEARQRTVTEFIVPALLSDAPGITRVLDRLAAYVAEDVRCQSPALLTTSRTELVSALVDGDDAVTNVSVTLSDLALVGSTSFVEWRLWGRFTHPTFLDDDVMIEASGRPVTAVGAMVLSFDGDRVAEIRCYYDPADLDAQLLQYSGHRTHGR